MKPNCLILDEVRWHEMNRRMPAFSFMLNLDFLAIKFPITGYKILKTRFAYPENAATLHSDHQFLLTDVEFEKYCKLHDI